MQSQRSLRLAPLLLLLTACSGGSSGARGEPFVVTQGLGMAWRSLSHRVSVLEVGITPGLDGYQDALVVAENHGGTFGSIDMPGASLVGARVAHPQVAYDRVSVWVEIPPGSTVDGERSTASLDVVHDAPRLHGASVVTGLIAGYRVDTNRYPTPPAFQTDPTLPYDPKDGFTSQGFGVEVSDVVVDGDTVRFAVRAQNLLGLSDRPDMNAAIPLATSWVRVDVLLVGLYGDARVTTGSVGYFLDDPVYGDHVGPAHADAATRTTRVVGAPGYPVAFSGLRSFHFYVNEPGHHSTNCVVAQDAVNSWGDMVQGPGRYLREANAAIVDFTYDATAGHADVGVDLYASAHSSLYEEGNLCFEGRAEVALVQLADPAVDPIVSRVRDVTFFSGEPWTEPF